MADILVLIHTISPLILMFDRLCAEILPGVQPRHILDEPLLEGIRQRGGLVSSDATRLWDHLKMAESIRGRAVLVTCSTISPLVDNLRPLTALPVVKINEAMTAAAVQAGPRLGVLTTDPTALSPVQQMLEAQARLIGKEITCEAVLVEDAFAALINRDSDTHNRLIREAIIEVSPRVDAMVLAQASMAGVLEQIPERDRLAPIFTSPRLALEQVRTLIGVLGWG